MSGLHHAELRPRSLRDAESQTPFLFGGLRGWSLPVRTMHDARGLFVPRKIAISKTESRDRAAEASMRWIVAGLRGSSPMALAWPDS